jgi:hypothetical protein
MDNITKSDFIAMKFKYLTLKFQDGLYQDGGNNHDKNQDMSNVNNAALAVINCYDGSEKCDKVLATVASLYLTIFTRQRNLYRELVKLICLRLESTNKTNKNIDPIEVFKYFLNILLKANEFLNGIGTNVSVQDILANDSYSEIIKGKRRINKFFYDNITDISLFNIRGIIEALSKDKHIINFFESNKCTEEDRKKLFKKLKDDDKYKVSNTFIQDKITKHLLINDELTIGVGKWGENLKNVKNESKSNGIFNKIKSIGSEIIQKINK